MFNLTNLNAYLYFHVLTSLFTGQRSAGRMRRRSRFAFFSIILISAVISDSRLAHSQFLAPSPTRGLITQPIDEGNRLMLAGNTRIEANAANDRGPVPVGFRLEHMQLQLNLPAEKEQELEQLNIDLINPLSPSYHRWLTPDQFRQRFAPAPADVDAMTSWLQSNG
ncbi:MAG: protease pro-enzyme activation domain-containing protein, partial [Candidatus Acidiferrales bacterium]